MGLIEFIAGRKTARRDIESEDNAPPLTNGNQIINNPILRNTKINFTGKNNILYCENDGIIIEDSTISFKGNDSIIFLSKSRYAYRIKATVFNNSTCYIGANNYFNGALNIVASEHKNIIIGSDSLFSFGCWLRTADPHLVYDATTNERLNYSKSIIIGDHVWLGQSVMILKGSTVGSGTIVGAGSIVTGKTLSSNCSYAGIPAKKISENIFFLKDSVHGYTETDTAKSSKSANSEWLYEEKSTETITYEKLETMLSPRRLQKTKINYIKSKLASGYKKNRFFRL